jgi:hypothetical protein
MEGAEGEMVPNLSSLIIPSGARSLQWFTTNLGDFNMFQSGHRRYDQDNTPQPRGEDNWRYVIEDYARTPPKPTIDAEPSYENIRRGRTIRPSRIGRTDCREYWSVLAGRSVTPGNNAVMQCQADSGKGPGVATLDQAIATPARDAVFEAPSPLAAVFERVPDQSLIAATTGPDTGCHRHARRGIRSLLHTSCRSNPPSSPAGRFAPLGTAPGMAASAHRLVPE